MCPSLEKRYRFSVVVGISIALAGCATALETTAPTVQPTTSETETVGTELPDVELTSELLYQLLVGELAIQREQYQTAAEAFAKAAEKSQDYRIAERGTRVALRAKDYDRAQQTARIWARLKPKDTAPLEVVAMSLVKDGRIEEAQAVVDELLDLDSDNTGNVYRRLADLLSKQPNHEGALELLSRLIAESPNDPELYYAQAFLADRLKEFEVVIESIDKALELRPDWEEAALAKAAHLVSRQTDKESVVEFCKQFLEDNPEARRLRMYLARYLVDQGDLEGGFDEFVALIEQDPNSTDALYAAGLLGLQLEQFDQAEDYLKRNLKLRPNNDQIRLYLGQLANERERYDEAEQWYREIQSEGYYFEAQIAIAEVLAETKGIDAALEHLQTLHPGNQDAYVRWVLAQERVLRTGKRLIEAKDMLDTAVDRYPEDTDLIYARGLLAAQLDLLEIHERDMRKLLVKDPTNAHALNALGYTLADSTDRYEEAHTLIEQALSIRPEDPFILDSMGWVQYRLGNHADAIEYLERALTKREDAEIAAHLGEVLWVTGEQERAKEIWQRALDKHPDNDVLRNTLKKFNQ